MKGYLLSVFCVLSLSVTAQERYFFLTAGNPDSQDFQPVLNESIFIDILADEGIISGSFNKQNFKGIFEVKRVSSGFVKGFTYTYDLGYLQRDFVNDKAFNDFTMKLALANKFYFYPDFLASPNWHIVEISGSSSDSKLIFVRKN
ncbi:MAG: hypothetical protein NXI00_06575 [Cytophagales bacterium]|nr:hypothetical protein [Cytophagales bacterium]